MKPIKTLVILTALTLTACSMGPAPVNVEVITYGGGTKGIKIISTADYTISISNVVVNKGNCFATDKDKPAIAGVLRPIMLGQSLTLAVACIPSQVDVSVHDRGTWTFNFD
jgi:hypothetical protein